MNSQVSTFRSTLLRPDYFLFPFLPAPVKEPHAAKLDYVYIPTKSYVDIFLTNMSHTQLLSRPEIGPRLNPRTRQLFEQYVGLEPEEIESHVLAIV